jgi:hypothetical protein
MTEEKILCPHCGMPLSCWEPHPESGWDHDLLVCSNDQCSYFVRGREKICRECEQNFAYRFCYDPRTGHEWPIAAWCGGDLSLLKGRCRTA